MGGRLLPQAQQPWLSLVASTPERSSYNGLILLCFVAITAVTAWAVIRRWGEPATRRVVPWDCGYPEDSPATQYGAGSFAQPIRRVYGSVLFAASLVVMPFAAWALVRYRAKLEASIATMRNESAAIGTFLIDTLQAMKLVVGR